MSNNPDAESNDYRAQKVMAYWSIANASHNNFNGKTSGIDFFVSVVNNVQIPINNVPVELNIALIPESLKNFLKSKTVGYCECKYTDHSQVINDVSQYINIAKEKNSALKFFISHKLREDLKSERFSSSNDIEEGDKNESEDNEDLRNPRAKRVKNDEFNINVYSVFYDKNKNLTIRTLHEYPNPSGVFVIVETNLIVPK